MQWEAKRLTDMERTLFKGWLDGSQLGGLRAAGWGGGRGSLLSHRNTRLEVQEGKGKELVKVWTWPGPPFLPDPQLALLNVFGQKLLTGVTPALAA